MLNPCVTAVAVLGSVLSFVSAQNAPVNVTLVKQWKRAANNREHADVWGMTTPAGREFAFVGETAGIWFVETTDPQNMKQVGWWSAPSSLWRDFTNLGPYVYAVSEHHRGIRVIDMRNPDAPKDLGLVATSSSRVPEVWAAPRAHS